MQGQAHSSRTVLTCLSARLYSPPAGDANWENSGRSDLCACWNSGVGPAPTRTAENRTHMPSSFFQAVTSPPMRHNPGPVARRTAKSDVSRYCRRAAWFAQILGIREEWREGVTERGTVVATRSTRTTKWNWLEEGLVDPAEFDSEYKADPARFQVGRISQSNECDYKTRNISG